jgi:protein gp37
MGAATTIEWCDHTFNPWWGCTEVSPLCDRCYARTLDVRWFKGAHWGAAAKRRYFGDTHWREPIKWDRRALSQHRRNRVFCASMGDVFDNEVEQPLREQLWSLIRETPNLDWVILTKRIGNAAKMLPTDWGAGYPNVWLLASVDQMALERDAPKLLAIPAVVHGVSIEPQLAPVCLGNFARVLQWVIVGGESGAGARPFHLEWARSLIVECEASGTPIFVQKMGCKPFEQGRPLRFNDYAGSDLTEWPGDLRIRQFPSDHRPDMGLDMREAP